LKKPSDTKVGIVGVGLMGHGMAHNLLKNGYPLVAMEHPGNQPLEELLAMGATTRTRPCDIAAAVDVVIVCVTGTPEVEAVVCGPDGLLTGLRAGTVVIDCSTAMPESTRRLAAAVQSRGGRFVDAPMTRTAKHAREGRLNLLVGGESGTIEVVMPLLRSFAENVTLAGPVGAGHRLKLLHNFVSLGAVALIAEAAACAARGGIEPRVLVDVLATGGGAGVALDRLKPYLLEQDPSGLQFAMSNALKDIRYYAEMADESQAVHAIAEAVAGTYDLAVQLGGPRRMVPELVSVLTEAG